MFYQCNLFKFQCNLRIYFTYCDIKCVQKVKKFFVNFSYQVVDISDLFLLVLYSTFMNSLQNLFWLLYVFFYAMQITIVKRFHRLRFAKTSKFICRMFFAIFRTFLHLLCAFWARWTVFSTFCFFVSICHCKTFLWMLLLSLIQILFTSNFFFWIPQPFFCINNLLQKLYNILCIDKQNIFQKPWLQLFIMFINVFIVI